MTKKTLKQILKLEGLNDTQIEVVSLVVKAKSNAAISETIGLDENRIIHVLNTVFDYMGFNTRAQLIVWCLPHMDFESLNK